MDRLLAPCIHPLSSSLSPFFNHHHHHPHSSPTHRSSLSFSPSRHPLPTSLSISTQAKPYLYGGMLRVKSVYAGEPEDYDEEEGSLDLLFHIFQRILKKVSKRATRAARKLLPPIISSQLVSFFVNGVVILSFLWILKSFLEVVCVLGSTIFIGLLLVRVLWSMLSYFQLSDKENIDKVNQGYYSSFGDYSSWSSSI